MWITINPSTFAMKKVSLVDKMSFQGPTSIPSFIHADSKHMKSSCFFPVHGADLTSQFSHHLCLP